MDKPLFGFIGCGNMGSALARAARKTLGASQILLTNRTAEKALHLSRELGCRAGINSQAARESDFLFLGVKPQIMPALLAELSPTLQKRGTPPVLVTMAAGLDMATVQTLAGAAYPVIRIMPNTPCAVGEGMLLCTATEDVTQEQRDCFQSAMAAAGRLVWLEEKLIDAGSAVSGCGPAFVYLFAEALADGGVACGLPRQLATACAAQTLLGAAKLLLESGSHPGALKDAVCSPGGSTIQGVRALEQAGFRGAVLEAVIAAYDKTLELGGKK
jgi:pyrroline-5-carboxylate reductase